MRSVTRGVRSYTGMIIPSFCTGNVRGEAVAASTRPHFCMFLLVCKPLDDLIQQVQFLVRHPT